jgi:hypothetical protein
LEEPITVVGIWHEERQREVEHEMYLDVGRSKMDQGKGQEISKPKCSRHRGDLNKAYDKGQQKTWFSDTSKSKEIDELTWLQDYKEVAWRAVLASL